MEQYKYKLETYKGRATRHECPSCHTPQVFARYVDEQGNYVADNVGRCNREDKCGYHLTPSEYFKDKGINYTPKVNVIPKPLPPTDYIPEEMVIRSLTADNHLFTFLIRQFGVQRVASILDTYYIGDGKGKKTIFWQYDEQGRVRTGKIMLYDPRTGRRVKNQPNSFDWAHRHIKSDYQLEQCLFGQHLLARENKPIAIVESEKSAVIASIVVPDYTWIATGGKSNFRLMEVLRGQDVTLFPDLGAYEDWREHAGRYGYKVSTLLEDIATPQDKESGLDIADFFLRQNKAV